MTRLQLKTGHCSAHGIKARLADVAAIDRVGRHRRDRNRQRLLEDFVEKPFDPQRMLDAVSSCLASLTSLEAERIAREDAKARLDTLTPRERQVFDALIDGCSNKEIAQRLEISPRTVEIFRAKVMTKMQAANLSTLVRIGMRAGDA